MRGLLLVVEVADGRLLPFASLYCAIHRRSRLFHVTPQNLDVVAVAGARRVGDDATAVLIASFRHAWCLGTSAPVASNVDAALAFEARVSNGFVARARASSSSSNDRGVCRPRQCAARDPNARPRTATS